MAVKAPRLPRTPPQKHHKNTTPAPLFSSKTPAKALIHHSKKNAANFTFHTPAQPKKSPEQTNCPGDFDLSANCSDRRGYWL
jgi:hypothetical protein